MKKYKYFLFSILIISSSLIISSCDFESDNANKVPKVYISIYLINCTKEPIKVYAGAKIFIFSLPSTVIPPGGQQSVAVEKGETVSFYGQTSNKNYGSRSFYFETQWEIH